MFTSPSTRRRACAGMLGAAALLVAGIAPGHADTVSPDSYTGTLGLGQSSEVTKTVTLDEAPPVLDFHLLIDLSGSYGDDLPNIKALSGDLATGINDVVDDATFGVSSFVDFPCSPWGGVGDYAYDLHQAQTGDASAWQAAINDLEIEWGGDGPESQYEGIFQAVTGAGNDGGSCAAGAVPSGLDAQFRTEATKVLAITTDASFHDSDTEAAYPGAGKAETIAALQAAGVKVLAIKAPGSGSEMDDLAAATGGAVVTTSSSSDDIVDAVLEGLAALTVDITATPVDCDPLEVTFAPASYEDVSTGASYDFTETIALPADADLSTVDGGVITCSVDFRADGALIGSQSITITVIDVKVTGGGFLDGEEGRVTFGFNAGPNVDTGELAGQLQLNDHATGDRFHGSTVDALGASGKTATWTGSGRWNGEDGHTFEATIVDDGNGKRSADELSITISDGDGNVVASYDGPLAGGNVKIHR